MRRLTRNTGLLLMLSCFAATLRAQQHPTALIGERVRVWAEAAWLPREFGRRPLVGTLLHADSTEVRIGLGKDAPPVGIPRSGVTRIEVSRGQRSRVAAGIGLGFLIGAAVGALVGSTVIDEEKSDLPSGAGAGLGALLGAPIGMLMGGHMGSEIKVDRWQPARLPQPSGIGHLLDRASYRRPIIAIRLAL